MLKSIAARSVTVVAAIALVVSQAAFLTPVVPEAKAEPQISGATHRPHPKGDRLAGPGKGAACSSRGWPHYEQSCQFDRTKPASETPTIRVIALR
jgi:hypothetical protein